MKNPLVTILKLGGSVITDKNNELKVRTAVIHRLAKEIKNAEIQNLIIVHGGGSFGHPIADRHKLSRGFKEKSQKIGFCKTRQFMTLLNGLLMDELIYHSIPAVSLSPSSFMITKNGKINLFKNTSLKMLLNMDFVPVLFGDAVLDSTLGFTILSGDQIVSFLASKFNAKRIIIGVDVDGLYDADPKNEKSAKFIEIIGLKNLKNLQRRLFPPKTIDVTGGMLGKITELLPSIEIGIPVTIVNALKPNYIYKVLKGKKVKSTFIKKLL